MVKKWYYPAKIMDFVGGQVPKIHHEYVVPQWMKTPDRPDPGASRCWWHGYPHANLKQHKKTWMVVDYSFKGCWYPLVNVHITMERPTHFLAGKIHELSTGPWLQCTIGRFCWPRFSREVAQFNYILVVGRGHPVGPEWDAVMGVSPCQVRLGEGLLERFLFEL